VIDVVWVQALGTLLLGLVGLWFANSYRRQVRVQLAERQLDAYTRLWTITERALPDRDSPLSRSEREEIHAAMVKWYFADGDGVLLAARTRNLFVAVRTNLVCPPEAIVPSVLGRQVSGRAVEGAERQRGCISIRQMSLLRTQLKSDLSIHNGYRYYSALRPDDRALLKASRIPLWRKPWRALPGVRAPRRAYNPCVCGLCDGGVA